MLLPCQQAKLARGAKDKVLAMSRTPNTVIAVIGIDIGKNSFHSLTLTAFRCPSINCFSSSGESFGRSIVNLIFGR